MSKPGCMRPVCMSRHTMLALAVLAKANGDELRVDLTQGSEGFDQDCVSIALDGSELVIRIVSATQIVAEFPAAERIEERGGQLDG